MEKLAESLMEELNCETVFTIPVLGGIGVSESVVVTWIIMAFMVLLSLLLTRNLKVHGISKRQAALEYCVTWLNNLVEGMLGKEAKEYAPYLVTVLLYLGVSNVIGLFGFKPPTKDLNTAAALALMSIVLIEAAGIRKKGSKKMGKKFCAAGGDYRTHQCSGNLYPSIVAVHAAFRKRPGSICYYGTDQTDSSGRASSAIQLLF